MRVVAGQFQTPSSSDLQFVKQMGVEGITFNALDLDDYRNRQGIGLPMRPHGILRESWDYDDLCRLCEWIERHGLALEALENVPHRMMNDIKGGTDDADRQTDAYCRTIENMGRAEIPVLGYNFSVLPVVRTSLDRPVRGGAISTAFDRSEIGRMATADVAPTDADEIWTRYTRFITTVLPVAESAGVTLALHPDDPPVPRLFDVDRILCTREDFVRALGVGNSPMHKLDFCVGTWAERGVNSMYDALTFFARQNKIAYAHLRNISDSGDSFMEMFIDDGIIDTARVLEILADAGFGGFVIDDHVPQMIGDTGWAHRGRAFSTGFLKGLLKMLAHNRDASLSR